MSSHKSNESNKIFAAVLCALITVMLSSFIANQIIKPEALEKDAVEIEGASASGHSAVDAGPKLPDPIMALLAEADTEKGAKISKACAACHSFEKGGPVKQGPNLWGIVGKAKGSIAGFAYSDDLIAKGGEWDYDSLNHFLEKPKRYISGTKMNFAGLKKAKDRAALIGWLREQADSQAALPTDAEIAAEQAAFAPPEPEEAPEEEKTADGEATEATTEEAPTEDGHH
ncbi:MAG: c-type cytochrome [Alphaproteobacteria bacterium]